MSFVAPPKPPGIVLWKKKIIHINCEASYVIVPGDKVFWENKLNHYLLISSLEKYQDLSFYALSYPNNA